MAAAKLSAQNDIGSVFVPQTVEQQGMLDREFRDYVARTRRAKNLQPRRAVN